MPHKPYAAPRRLTDPRKCYFYHTVEVPGFGLLRGRLDLRGRERDYLGGVPLRGKRVLEIGPANGGLSFYMERQGAEVVAYDLSDRHGWDMVPYARLSASRLRSARRSTCRLTCSREYWTTPS